MQESLSRAVALAAVLMLVPLAAAGGDVALPGLQASIEDSRGSRCDQPVAGFCFLEVDPQDGPGNATVDVNQDVREAALHADPDAAAPGGHDLAPDLSLVLRADRVYAQHPLLRLVSETWTAATPDYPLREDYGLAADRRGIRVYYHGPLLSDLAGPFGRGALGVHYTEGITYEQVGPFNTIRNGQTDTNWEGLDILLCDWGVAERECEPVADAASAAILAATPNVELGFEVHEVAVATEEPPGDAPVA
ncbi:MAG TPA: hypothetical protein VNX21_03470, partial [Candidatus Thermoplasmatota archaeon]|nr:hypothetical protein [Candidatus Thermoplasmatota archaeon]